MNEPKITLTDLSVNDVNILLSGLGKLPLDVVFDVFMRIKAQGEAQIPTPESAGLSD
jgi:hypothetical protein